MTTDLSRLLEAVPKYREQLSGLREILLANAVMCGEIPAPTFGEENLGRFLTDRFTECGLDSVATDEAGNVFGVIHAENAGAGTKNILVAAHIDKIWSETADHTVSVTTGSLSGPGIADNSLGVAVLASLPTIFESLGVRLRSNLVVLGTVCSFGRGDLQGMRFFLENSRRPIAGGICVEGMQLGRLSYSCLGMRRGEIVVNVPAPGSTRSIGSAGAIAPLNKIISRILAIGRPERPRTEIRIGSIEAGSNFNVAPRFASLRFEIRSEEAEIVDRILHEIEEIVDEINAAREAGVTLQSIAQRQPGDIGFSHPLVFAAREILETLGVRPVIDPSMSELAALLDRGIPGLTIGITEGSNRHTRDETALIKPIFSGLAHLVAVLQFLDSFVNENEKQP